MIDAREHQRKRLDAQRVRTNAEIPDAALDELVDATAEARALLGRAVETLRLSARGARRVEASAMAEALGYRGDEVL